MPIPSPADLERTPLQNAQPSRQGITRYGSIVASPPDSSPTLSRRDAPSLRLPAPALDSAERRESALEDSLEPQRTQSHQDSASAYHVGPVTPPRHQTTGIAPRYRSLFQPKRVNSLPTSEEAKPARPTTKRKFTFGESATMRSPGQADIVMSAYRNVDIRQAEFFLFLDKELDKIEGFYKQKEDEAVERLKILRQQLHILRDEHDKKNHADEANRGHARDLLEQSLSGHNDARPVGDGKRTTRGGWYDDLLYRHLKPTRGWKTAQAMNMLSTPSGPRPLEAMSDYVRGRKQHDMKYRNAKHKLKLAMAEYYRGLELLKSYALLNRTAFRKITKKFDKTVHAHPSGRYMAEKVNKAYFVKSDVLESLIETVEDLYARYFERGNHKIAVGKLRAKGVRSGDYTGNVFRNGLLLGVGSVFAVQGVVKAAQLLSSRNPVIVSHTSYLLQVSQYLVTGAHGLPN